jgi:MATE family multidrug resistance protein
MRALSTGLTMTELLDEAHQPQAHESGTLLQRVSFEWLILARLGAPILIAQLAQMANGVIDTLMAGRYGADDLTGVAIGYSLWMPIFLFVVGVLNAQQPLISGFNGARLYKHVTPVAWHGIYLALIAALIAMMGLNQVSPLLQWLSMEPAPAAITTGYLFAFSMGIPPILLIISLRGLTDGLGHTRIIMVFTLIAIAINAPLNYVLIFGKFGMPAMGGVGCGWATTIANWIALLALWIYLHRATAFKDYHLWSHRIGPRLQHFKDLLRLGIPIGFTIFVEATMFSVIAIMIVPLGSIVVAGHQIALNIVSVLFMVPLSLGMALTLRISFLVGADQCESARLVARSSVFFALGIALSFAGMLLLSRSSLAGLYTNNNEVLEKATYLLFFGAIFQLADVMQVSAINALRGFKDTRIPMYIMLFSFWVIGIPLGYILTFNDWITEPMGAAGFWIGLTAGLAHAALWLILRVIWISRKVSE